MTSERMTQVVGEKPVAKKISLPLGYSPHYTPDDDSVIRGCTEIRSILFHTKIIGTSVQLSISDAVKDESESIHFEFCGPSFSTHRFPNGSTLLILGVVKDSVEFCFQLPNT